MNDNFFDLTDDVSFNYTGGAQVSEPKPEPENPSLSPSMKRKRKFEEMEAEQLNLDQQNTADNDIINNNNNENGVIDNEQGITTEIEVVLPPPQKKQRIGSPPTLHRLLYANNFSDIVFQVENKQFPVIKAIFAVKSRKFEEMLYPANNENVAFIAIQDITAGAFGFIRDFCYDLEVVLEDNNVIDILHATKIYEITKLHGQCIDYLKQIDNVDGLLSILKEISDKSYNNCNSDFCNETGDFWFEGEVMGLLDSNIGLMQKNGCELIENELFSQLPFSMICKIIGSDNLGVKEEDLWNACKQWKNENDFKTLIRFCLMDLTFLYNSVKPSGVLSETDLVSIYEKKLGLVDGCLFNCNQRIIVNKRKSRGRKKKSPKKKQEIDEEDTNDNDDDEPKDDGNDGDNGDDDDDDNKMVVDDDDNEEEKEEVKPKRGRGRGRARSKSTSKKTTPAKPKRRGRSRRGKK